MKIRAGALTGSVMFIAHSSKAVFSTIGEAVVLVAGIVIFFFLLQPAGHHHSADHHSGGADQCVLHRTHSASRSTPLTLLAMVLAVGLVVDDAIVVLENIHRHIEWHGAAAGGADRHPRDWLRGGRHVLTLAARVRAAPGLCDRAVPGGCSSVALALAGADVVGRAYWR